MFAIVVTLLRTHAEVTEVRLQLPERERCLGRR